MLAVAQRLLRIWVFSMEFPSLNSGKFSFQHFSCILSHCDCFIRVSRPCDLQLSDCCFETL